MSSADLCLLKLERALNLLEFRKASQRDLDRALQLFGPGVDDVGVDASLCRLVDPFCVVAAQQRYHRAEGAAHDLGDQFRACSELFPSPTRATSGRSPPSPQRPPRHGSRSRSPRGRGPSPRREERETIGAFVGDQNAKVMCPVHYCHSKLEAKSRDGHAAVPDARGRDMACAPQNVSHKNGSSFFGQRDFFFLRIPGIFRCRSPRVGCTAPNVIATAGALPARRRSRSQGRRQMRRGNALMFGVALLLVGTVVAMPTSALAKSARAKANSQTFTDSTGEDPNAPDITTIVVSNDDAGLITFKINISNRPDFDGGHGGAHVPRHRPEGLDGRPAVPRRRVRDRARSGRGRPLQVERHRLRRGAVAVVGHVQLRRHRRDDPRERRGPREHEGVQLLLATPSRGSRPTRAETPTSRTRTTTSRRTPVTASSRIRC